MILKPKEKYLQQSLTEKVVVTKSVNIDSQKAENDKVDYERLPKKDLEKAKIVKNQKCEVTCEICGSLFLYKWSLNRHVNSVHLKLKPFQCKTCLEYFTEKRGLQKHMIKVHEQSSTETVVGTKSVNLDSQKTKIDKVDNERPSKKALEKAKIVRNQKCKVTCETCGCLFLYKSNLKRHINLVHLKLKPFQCEICLKYFAEKKVLHKHKIKFHGEMVSRYNFF